MADVVQDVVANITEKLTENSINGTAKVPATPEGMAVAYSSLVIMALLPIFFGSFRSVKHHKEQTESGETPERMTHKDAAMFPLIASAALFGLYIFFKLFSKEYINLLLTGYFFFLGIFALCHLMSPLICSLVPAAIPIVPFHLRFTKGLSEGEEYLVDYKFNSHDLVCLGCCSVIGAWYIVKKHWIANNLFGIAFAINGVELLHLNKVVTGCILLCGLFVYDIFWVFGTNVMVTVAKSFEAPIKLVFPQDLLEKGVAANNFAMLGLGDIVVPGIFIALLLRFDMSLNRNSKFYFYSTFVAYFLGLVATIFVMHMFKHAQPALLYLVPACLGTPLSLALIKGDIGAMFQYADHPDIEDNEFDEFGDNEDDANYNNELEPNDKFGDNEDDADYFNELEPNDEFSDNEDDVNYYDEVEPNQNQFPVSRKNHAYEDHPEKKEEGETTTPPPVTTTTTKSTVKAKKEK